MLVFKVTDTFRVDGKGLLLSGSGKPNLKGVDFRSELKLILPNKSELFTSVVGINWQNGDLIVSDVDKLVVPNGTEVWLIDSK
ncbi:MAG: hypothetical protein K9G46_10630 [Flavobacteriales bacterium]|nr:hypothetical protein [Flavobacteriales bacterium]